MCMVETADEIVILLHQRSPRARKEHQCTECCRTILKGETYTEERYFFDGNLSTHKTCPHCLQVRTWLIIQCGGFVYGGLLEDIVEHAEEIPLLSVARLAIGIRNQWKRRKTGKLWPLVRVA